MSEDLKFLIDIVKGASLLITDEFEINAKGNNGDLVTNFDFEIENAKHSEMHYNLMCTGIGAVLTGSLAIAQKPYDENILFFVPKSEESYRKIYIAYNYFYNMY